MYRSIFIDLDNTVWDFSQNSTDTFREIYEKYHFERYFDSFEQFFALYKKKNEELWMKYGNGQITKDNLNAIRYAYPFRQVDAYDEKLIHAYTEDYMRHIALKKKLMLMLEKRWNICMLTMTSISCLTASASYRRKSSVPAA